MEKHMTKPEKPGVYYVVVGNDWGIIVADEYPDGLHCPINGQREDWPDGVYIGPVGIEDILSLLP